MVLTRAEPSSSGLSGLLQRYPLTSFFLIALAISWAVVIVVVASGFPTTWVTIVAIAAGPAISAFIMTAVTEGSAGARRLLQRLVVWRVPLVWYLFAFLGVPAIFVLGTVFLPGATASFDPLTPQKWLTYLWMFPLVAVVGGPLLEEPGWRGFALSRLQEKFGPLIGTMILGLLWAAWHYPQYMMPDWAAQNGGFSLKSAIVFTIAVLPITIILTWVFNNTRGSLLAAILVHASVNTFSAFIGPLFPAQAASQVNAFIGFGAVALLIIVLTRGRLDYDRYLSEAERTG
ncbi:CAAX protease self-immunity [Rhizobiales bacterium GAS191]|nr:CAAX protease self-immunity [Rhizobiales bacterium GAS191]